MAYWQPIRGISDPIPIRKFDGVYKPDDEGFNLPDNLFTELINFSPEEHPAITTRPGYSVIGTFTGPVLGIGAWKDQELHALFADGSWRRLNGDGTWTSLATGLSTSAEWSFCNFQGNLTEINLIASNGIDAIKRYNGTTVQNLSNAPAGGNFIDTHDNRVYCALGNTVKFSALRKPTDWTTVDDAGEIVIETNDGELISGLKAGPKHLIVFKPNSIFDLLGSGPADYYLNPVTADIGAVNNNCIVNLGGMVYFLHTTGVYIYSSARPKRDFSRPVLGLIKRMNVNALNKCRMGTDGQNLFVAIPLDSATEADTILQYSIEQQAWYTWSGYAAHEFQEIGSKVYIGDNSGSVRLVGGTSDAGTAITSTAITKPFTAGSIARKQRWFKLWVVASVPTGCSLSVYVSGSADGEDWQLVKTITADTDLQYKQLLVPTNSIASANAVRIKLVATGPVTVHEITRQLRELPMRR